MILSDCLQLASASGQWCKKKKKLALVSPDHSHNSVANQSCDTGDHYCVRLALAAKRLLNWPLFALQCAEWFDWLSHTVAGEEGGNIWINWWWLWWFHRRSCIKKGRTAKRPRRRSHAYLSCLLCQFVCLTSRDCAWLIDRLAVCVCVCSEPRSKWPLMVSVMRRRRHQRLLNDWFAIDLLAELELELSLQAVASSAELVTSDFRLFFPVLFLSGKYLAALAHPSH